MPPPDFTLAAYRMLLDALAGAARPLRLFRETPWADEAVVALRHDVDRLPARALAMAETEAAGGIAATYFMRVKPHAFDPGAVRRIAALGHEIGYHYEDLADAGGDLNRAWDGFRRNLARLRAIAPVVSIAMHGRPFSRHDSRALWERFDYRDEGIVCEAYLDIDWHATRYFTDTGGGWNGTANVRDRPQTADRLDSPAMPSTAALAAFIRSDRRNTVVSIHPERWPGSALGRWQARATDRLVNIAKSVLAARPPA